MGAVPGGPLRPSNRAPSAGLAAADPPARPGREHRPHRDAERVRQGTARDPPSWADHRRAVTGVRPQHPAGRDRRPGAGHPRPLLPTPAPPAPTPRAAALPGPGLPRPAQARTNPKYPFEPFAMGPSNRFAPAAAVAVAEAPAKAYNPLFIYGDSGLGKTHLLHAIGHYTQSLYQGVKVRYVSSEEFTNDFINIIRDGKQDGFRRRYCDVDVLLVDDIPLPRHKQGTPKDISHTFN